jgi:hypothetical protein
MSPNATFSFDTTELSGGNNRAASLLGGSVDRNDSDPLDPYNERHQESLYFPESCSVEYCQPQGHVPRPKWDRSSFRNSRPRSKAIPVESKTDMNDSEKIQFPESDDGMYDQATWRMYNRITYHRQKYPLKASQTTMIPRFVHVQQVSDFASPQWYHVNLLPCDVVYPTPIRCSDRSLLDDEIFEFEL